ncbi:hypothetical protein BJ742DRAFT_127225 [Cladochytrium replicatum]|nr:hypothetical protein BJ742DRAFT_127225 [Cladochytrium replicatum]
MITQIERRTANIRPAYHDLQDWCNETEHILSERGGVVFVKRGDGGRQPFPKHDNVLHNPFKIGAGGVRDRDSACDQYRVHFENKLDDESRLGNEEEGKFHVAMREAMGKRLGCWCKPMRCHADKFISELKARFCNDSKLG